MPIRDRARYLRFNMTHAEKILWRKLRDRKFLNLKFKRQRPLIFLGQENIGIIADFYCDQYKLIIELDGSIHCYQDVKDYDKFKESILKSNGYKVLRFENHQVINNLDQVLAEIAQFVAPLSQA